MEGTELPAADASNCSLCCTNNVRVQLLKSCTFQKKIEHHFVYNKNSMDTQTVYHNLLGEVIP